MPLIMSKAPARASSRRTRQTRRSCPAAAIASPQPAAASTIARPCRWIRVVQPLVRLTSRDPAGSAAYSPTP